MDGFATLKRLDVQEIHKKTHISITEINAFLNKDFAQFNRTKALGFIKILEREYDVDLSDLQEEFESFQAVHNEANEQIFLVAKDEKTVVGKWAVVVAVLVALLLAIGYLSFSQPASRAASTGATSPAPNSLIAQAQEAIAQPKEEAAQLASVVQEGTITGTETVAPAPVTPVTPTAPAVQPTAPTVPARQTPTARTAPAGSAAQPTTPAGSAEQPAAPTAQTPITPAAPTPTYTAPPPTKPSTFYVISNKDLWIGIYYLDDEHREQITMSGRHDFDSARPQIVTFGHGEFRLVYGSKVIEPNSGYVQRLRFRNGEVTQLPTASQIRREQEVQGTPAASATPATPTTPAAPARTE